jgi:hypothetical protein
MEETMNKIVKGLRSLGYRVITSRLTDEENMTWANMVASATSAQQVANLSAEETAWWTKQVASESCLCCAYNGEEFCSSHN